MSYNHGVKINETDTGAQAISTVSGSVIGIVGTAPEADAETFPLGAPVMVAGSRSKAAKLGAETLLHYLCDVPPDEWRGPVTPSIFLRTVYG